MVSLTEIIEATAPDAFFGTISGCVMRDPVIEPSGHTYDRALIEDWLLNNNTSPVSRLQLRKEQLIENRALRSLITDFVSKIRRENPAAVDDWHKTNGTSPRASAKRANGALPPIQEQFGPTPLLAQIPSAPFLQRALSSELVLPDLGPPVQGQMRIPVLGAANAIQPFQPESDGNLESIPVLPLPAHLPTDAGLLTVASARDSGRGFGLYSLQLFQNFTPGGSDFACAVNSSLCWQFHSGGAGRGVVKAGDGLALRVMNERSGVVHGVLVVPAHVSQEHSLEYGDCFGWVNPFDQAVEGSFQEGDRLHMLDYPLPSDFIDFRILDCSPTGWRVTPESIRLGCSGIVGDFWRQLSMTVMCNGFAVGFWTDAVSLDAVVTDGESGDVIEFVTDDANPNVKRFSAGPLDEGKTVKFTWPTTDMSKLGGLSTFRDGGGLHLALI